MNVKFAQNLKDLRLQNKLTQAELGAILQTTQRKVSYLESGQVHPDLETLCRIADYFEVSVDFLLGRKNFF